MRKSASIQYQIPDHIACIVLILCAGVVQIYTHNLKAYVLKQSKTLKTRQTHYIPPRFPSAQPYNWLVKQRMGLEQAKQRGISATSPLQHQLHIHKNQERYHHPANKIQLNVDKDILVFGSKSAGE